MPPGTRKPRPGSSVRSRSFSHVVGRLEPPFASEAFGRAAHEEHHPERHDERHDLEPRDQEPADEAADGTGADAASAAATGP